MKGKRNLRAKGKRDSFVKVKDEVSFLFMRKLQNIFKKIDFCIIDFIKIFFFLVKSDFVFS